MIDDNDNVRDRATYNHQGESYEIEIRDYPDLLDRYQYSISDECGHSISFRDEDILTWSDLVDVISYHWSI